MKNISKKLIVTIAVAIITLAIGGLFWHASIKERQTQMEQRQAEMVNQQQIEASTKSDFDKRNKTLTRSHITGVADIEGDYKKVTISDGDVSFTFEVPDKWLTETRNSREVEMNTEELWEFFATNYDGDIRAKEVCNDVSVIDYSKDPAGVNRIDRMCGQPSGDYWDFTWDMLKDMSYEKMESLFVAGERGDFLPNYPSASVSSVGYIWYTDGNNYQTDFYILSPQSAEKSWNWYAKGKSIKDITIDGKVAKLVIDKSDGGKGSGFREILIPLTDSKVLFINKQFYPEDEIQSDFDYLLDTLKFE